jgi:hypothetical protein
MDTDPELPQGSSSPALPGTSPDALKAIRTYETDVAEAIKENHTSVADMIIAEKRREAGAEIFEAASPRSRRSILVVGGTAAAILLLGVGGFLLYVGLHAPAGTAAIHPTAFVVTDSEKEIVVPPASPARRAVLLALLSSVRSSSTLPIGSLENIYFTQVTATSTSTPSAGAPGVNQQKTTKRLLSTSNFLSVFTLTPPAELVRSLVPAFMYGQHAASHLEPFLIFKTNYYEGAFSGMLAWEAAMRNDLADVVAGPVERATVTGGGEAKFTDMIIRNKDARVLKNANGEPELIYAFPDQETIIITTNESTFRELIDRLAAAKFEK